MTRQPQTRRERNPRTYSKFQCFVRAPWPGKDWRTRLMDRAAVMVCLGGCVHEIRMILENVAGWSEQAISGFVPRFPSALVVPSAAHGSASTIQGIRKRDF